MFKKIIKEKWFFVINIISFLIAMLDGFYWRNSSGGFPIFTILGGTIATLIGIIYQIIRIIKNKYKSKLISFILLYFLSPYFGIVGGILGLLFGFMIF